MSILYQLPTVHTMAVLHRDVGQGDRLERVEAHVHDFEDQVRSGYKEAPLALKLADVRICERVGRTGRLVAVRSA